MEGFLDASAVELAGQIRGRQVRALDVVDAHIERCKAVNPQLNAIVVERYDAAREEARAADRRADAGEALPLLGVPCTLKEFFGVEGLPSTGGIHRYRDRIATTDATVVRRLREAGAIVLGVTNVPEGGLWMETYNSIYGRTNNPWSLRRTCGGSSGGEGAIVGAGGSAFGIGSDIGGSVRIPAAFCGTVGHKPSGRLVPCTGQFPEVHGEVAAALCIGPLTRRVSDLMPILRIIAGPDGSDPVTVTHDLGDPAGVDVSKLTVVPVESFGRVRVRETMRSAVQESVRALAERGARVEQHAFPRLSQSVEMWAAVLSTGAEVHYASVLGGGTPISPLLELARLPFGLSDHTFAGLVITLVDELSARLPGGLERYVEAARELRREIEETLGPDGVLIVPPYSRPAPFHRDAWRTPFDFACTAIFNAIESPVTVLPVAWSNGLPVAVQVVGTWGRDAVTIAAAQVLEDRFGGWKRANP